MLWQQSSKGKHKMKVQPGDVIIVLHTNGQVSFWEQDTSEVLAYLEAVEELSACLYPEAMRQQDEMAGWREQFVEKHTPTYIEALEEAGSLGNCPIGIQPYEEM